MSAAMNIETPTPRRGLSLAFSQHRIVLALAIGIVFGVMHDWSITPVPVWIARCFIVALAGLAAFGLFEQWPAGLPRWLARWVLQLVAVIVVIPFGTILSYALTGGGGFHAIMASPQLRNGFFSMIGPAFFFGPWIVIGAVLRQREALAREQQVKFQLERSELERQATAARLRLMQAQVQPHFLFNTLANVRALVKANSPQAPAVLDSLIAYLRAAVPGLGDADSTLGREVQLVRSYLELMHMRMPDRLQYSVHADDEALGLRCPPMTLLTLVENAVRHGIDPGEEGGRIDVTVTVRDGRCVARVVDTGVGLEEGGDGSGTGLETLRERMKLAFGEAQLRLAANMPHGVCAELEFPAQSVQRPAP